MDEQQNTDTIPAENNPAPKKPPRPWGIWAGAAVALALVAAGILFFTGAGRGLIGASHKSQLEKALEQSARLRAQEGEFRIQVAPDDLSVTSGLKEEWHNILLLGTDMGGEETTHGRTDAMLILSVHRGTGQIKLTSLIRDMLVRIPGASRGAKINAANAWGGPLLAVKTVNELLGLNIDRYCVADFNGFMEVVNLMGGTQVELTEAEAKEVGAQKQEGPQHLDGWQTLAFARIRRLDNNFGRNERQRKVLEALLEQARGLDTNTLMNTVSESFQHLATNLSSQEVLDLINVVLKNRDPMLMLSLPPAGKYRYEATANGESAVAFNTDTIKEAFFEFVYGSAAQPDTAGNP